MSLEAAAVELTRDEAERLAANAIDGLVGSERWERPDGPPRVLGREIVRDAVSPSAVSELSEGRANGRPFEAWARFWCELADRPPDAQDKLAASAQAPRSIDNPNALFKGRMVRRLGARRSGNRGCRRSLECLCAGAPRV